MMPLGELLSGLRLKNTEIEPPLPAPEYFLCLGAGDHQVPLIRAARSLGLRVVAVDRNLRAPGLEYADLGVQSSIFKPGRIHREILQNVLDGRIIGAASRSYGAANLSVAYLSRYFRTPGNPISAIRIFSNKRHLKKILAEAGVQTPTAYEWKRLPDRWRLLDARPPLIVRPARGHGKRGIELLKNTGEIRRFLDRERSDKGRLLVERVIRGQEVTVLGFVHRGRYREVCLTDKITSDGDPLFAEIMHRFPSRIGRGARLRIERQMQRIVQATGLQNGPLVAEFIVAGDRTPYLIECAPEAGGEYIADIIAPCGVGVDYFQEMIRITGVLAGDEALLTNPADTGRAIIIRYLLPRQGRLKKIFFPDRLREHPGFLFSRILKRPGDSLSPRNGNLDRPAVFALQDPYGDLHTLQKECEKIVEETVIQYEGRKRALGRSLSEE